MQPWLVPIAFVVAAIVLAFVGAWSVASVTLGHDDQTHYDTYKRSVTSPTKWWGHTPKPTIARWLGAILIWLSPLYWFTRLMVKDWSK